MKYRYDCYQRAGQQSYPWMRNTLQGLIAKAATLDTHRKHQERAPPPGIMQPASTTLCSLSPRKERPTVFRKCGMLSKREPLLGGICRPGEPLWIHVQGGGNVRETLFIPFGQDTSYLGIGMIPAYTPESSGRSEKVFRTHQDRPSEELAAHGINEMDNANRNLDQAYQPIVSTEFTQPAAEKCFSFVPWKEANLCDILCEKYKRTGTADNCFIVERYSIADRRQQVPRCHYVKIKVHAHRYMDGLPAVFHDSQNWPTMVIKKQGEIQKMKVQRKSAARIHIMTESLWDSSSSALTGKVKAGRSFAIK